MYKDHIQELRVCLQSDPEDMFFRVNLFVLLSIRTHFHRLGDQMKDVLANGDKSKYIWGYKKKTLSYLKEHNARLAKKLLSEPPSDKTLGDHENEIIQVPGFGYPKTNFVLQLMGHNTGCIDVHNWNNYGLSQKYTLKDLKKRNTYASIVNELGGSEVLWDNWCTHISKTQAKYFNSPEEVSKYHISVITQGIN